MTRPARMLVLASPASQGADGNPYLDQLYAALARQGVETRALTRRGLIGGCDVVHVHWPEQLVRWRDGRPTALLDVVKVLLTLWVARRRGAALVWTAHNLEPHEQPMPRLLGLYLRGFARLVDAVISLGDGASAALRERHPWIGDRVTTIPHGHYRQVYGARGDQAAARTALGLEDRDSTGPVLLLMGQVKRYKGVLDLVDAVEAAHAPGPSDVRLLVCGSVRDPGLERELRERAGPHTLLRLATVPTAEVATLHAAADVVVLPYSSPSTLNSGAAILGLSLGRPVVVPRTRPMVDLQRQAGPDWVWLYDGDASAAVATATRAAGAPRRGEPDLSAMDWDVIGRATAQLFRTLTGAPSPATSHVTTSAEQVA